MEQVVNRETGIIAGEKNDLPEAMVLNKERWEEVRRMHGLEKLKVSEIARRLDVDRKTVRKALQGEWRRYERAAKSDTLLAEHDAFVRGRSAEVNFSARILYQELVKQRGFTGSYQTVKGFVAPLRAAATVGSVCERRFETEPGRQSQIDWGQARRWPSTLDSPASTRCASFRSTGRGPRRVTRGNATPRRAPGARQSLGRFPRWLGVLRRLRRISRR